MPYQFPDTTDKPSFPIEETYEDNTIRSPLEAGYELTRPRYTKLRKRFRVRYVWATQDTKDAIENFYQTVQCSEIFEWTHPKEGTTYNVRFVNPPRFTYEAAIFWNIEFELREV